MVERFDGQSADCSNSEQRLQIHEVGMVSVGQVFDLHLDLFGRLKTAPQILGTKLTDAIVGFALY